MYGVHHYRLGPLWEYDYSPVGDEESVSPTRRPEWCASSIYHHRDTERVPHIKCIIIYESTILMETIIHFSEVNCWL